MVGFCDRHTEEEYSMGISSALTPRSGSPALYGVDCLEQMVEQEVRSWYRTFYSWSRGLCPKEESGARPIFNSLSEDFRVLLTSGIMMNKSEYWERLLSLHGVRRGDPPSQIVNLEMVRVEKDHVLVTFDLFKRGVLKKKFDTALMRRATDMPSGVAWVYVHESDHALVSEPEIRRVDSGALVTD
jgi:hypothetical protein